MWYSEGDAVVGEQTVSFVEQSEIVVYSSPQSYIIQPNNDEEHWLLSSRSLDAILNISY